MLSKLIKHELKATSRMLLPLYLALVVLTIMDRIVLSFDNYEGALVVIPGFITFAYVVSLIAIVVVSFVIIIIRFYKNMITDEGYLMFTIPVKPSQHIVSKLLVSVLWNLASLVAVILSLLGVFATPDRMSTLLSGLHEAMAELTSTLGSGATTLIIIEFIILCLLGIINSILEIYASIALGQLFNGHRILASIGSYIAISTVAQIIMTLLLTVVGLFANKSYDEINTIPQSMFLITIAYTLVFNVAYFWLTNYLFKKKLNLE